MSAQSQDSPAQQLPLGRERQDLLDEHRRQTSRIGQLLPWGTSYAVGYDSNRFTTNNLFASFNPQLGGNLDLAVVQPLLRDFRIDNARYQLMVSKKNREIADVDLQQTIALTVRSVKNAYWDYKYALASLDVARQSLDLAQESLRNTRSRVEIGTLAPIDVVQAESEVAQREEAVILAEASIGQTEDRLRSLIFDPNTPDFWNMRLEPTDPVPFQVQAVDVDAAIRRALAERTDLAAVEEVDRAHRRTPSGTTRTRRCRASTCGSTTTRPASAARSWCAARARSRRRSSARSERPYSDLLGDVFSSAFPTWRFSVNVSYPIGQSNADASLARTRLETRQSQTNLRNLELQVATQVRDAGRQLMANSKRVDATRAARVLAERRLEAEEKKFAAGMSTSFLVFQAQRDLAQARNTELRAVLDYTQVAGGLRDRAGRARQRRRRPVHVGGGDRHCARPVHERGRRWRASSNAAGGGGTNPVAADAAHRPASEGDGQRTGGRPLCFSRRSPYTRRVPALSVTIITFNEAAHLAAAHRVGRLGRRDRRRRLGQHRRHRGHRAAARDARRGPRVARLCGAEELRRLARAARLDSLARRGRACRRRAWPRRSTRGGRASRPRPGYRVARTSWYLGEWIRTTDWYPDYQLRLYDRRAGAWQPARVHESVRVAGDAGAARRRDRALSVRGRERSPAAHRPLHDAGRARPAGARAPGGSTRRCCCHPPAAFLRNYVAAAAASCRAAPGSRCRC